tara:strand:- start:1201 stop:1803 length:603 start_codon:yes stop_codon:yes gene_type:complete
MSETLYDLAKKFEAYETDEWAAKAILSKEIMTKLVRDPCTGRGMLARVAESFGYAVDATDLAHCWGYGTTGVDFLTSEEDLSDVTVFMNPPFSKAVEFVLHAKKLGAKKIICFQRFSWYEGSKTKGRKRGQFWADNPPSRVYICGDRASCWRMDLTPEETGKMSNTPTAHAWFIWERNAPSGTMLSHIYKEDAVSQAVTE